MPLAAQTIAKAGDHEGFTRIVLPTKKPDTIQAKKIGRTIVVSGDPGIKDLDVTSFFTRINKFRITAITIDKTASRATIQLACNCQITSSVLLSGHLVIDVSDTQQRSSAIKDIGRRFINHALQKHLSRPSVLMSKKTKNELNLNEIRASLEQGISDAVKTGNLNENSGDTQKTFDISLHDPLAQNRGVPNSTAPLSQMNLEKTCNQKKLFFEETFTNTTAEQISTARRAIAQETEFAAGTKARDLVRTYLVLGFGAEARAVMRTSNQSDRALLALSYILDTGEDHIDYFSHLAGCDHQVAYWSIFNKETNLKKLNTRAILEAVQQLPKGMMHATAATALENLKARADLVTYNAVKAPLERRLENWATKSSIPKEIKSAPKHHLSMDPQKTLLASFLTKVLRDYEIGRAVSEKDVQLLGGYQREYSNDLQSLLEIGKARAVALLSQGDISSAYDTITAMRDHLETKEYKKYINETVKSLVKIDDSFDFLEAAFPIISADTNHISLNHQVILSERLLELEILDLAQAVITSWRKPYPIKTQQILIARLSQLQDKPLAARSQLSGLSDKNALRALANIEMDLSHYSEAGAHFTKSKDMTKAAHAIWLSGNMPEALHDEPTLINLSRSLIKKETSIDEIETIKGRQRLLSETELQSRAIERILALSIED